MSQNRVSIILVGVNAYRHIPRLTGPEQDVDNFAKILTEDTRLSIYSTTVIRKIINPSSADLRLAISDYALSRSAINDILVFYFSGHGVTIGNREFGLCTIDTNVNRETNLALPSTLVRFRDIIETLSVAKVDPVFIIDACYSGLAGENLLRTYQELKKDIQAETGSAYALLCSSTKYESTPDGRFGGPFLNQIKKTIESRNFGTKSKKKPKLMIKDLFPALRAAIESSDDITPLLFIGDTLPDFPIAKNIYYKPNEVSIQSSHKEVLLLLWNNGNVKEISMSELSAISSSVYTTYNKLSYKPAWGLIEDVSQNIRKLSEKGIQFMNGEITIPLTIQKNYENGDWEPASGAIFVNASDLLQQQGFLFPNLPTEHFA
ncbi:caspase family protein [Leptospira sp. 201903070]|uniref:Caspase family protein n=1 Tax=Leptospira ainlahdjerensis TaxID=2810033 RepID=A0ABS2U7A7_9LEPT|nr:caspase family protein [Leptospira ainlahdjerensis]MBM9576217.1 caspase family protein [Leptospira ainlahdjerensis]